MITSLNDLVVAGWDGSEWVNLGQASSSGSPVVGQVTSTDVVPSAYAALTLARVIPSLSLPATLLSFEVEQVGNDAQLTWVAAELVNSDKYVIERSANPMVDGFEPVGEEVSRANVQELQSYTYTDPKIVDLESPTLSYRLKAVDLDEQFAYSNIRELILNDPQGVAAPIEMNVFPNPATSFAYIQLGASQQSQLQVRVISVDGKTVYDNSASGNSRLRLELGNWAEGTYIVSVSDGNQVASKKILVQP